MNKMKTECVFSEYFGHVSDRHPETANNLPPRHPPPPQKKTKTETRLNSLSMTRYIRLSASKTLHVKMYFKEYTNT